MLKKIILSTILTSFSFSNDYSLSFDGSDDYVTTSDVYDATTSFTFGAWVYDNGNGGVVMSKHFFNTDVNPPWGKYTGYMIGNFEGNLQFNMVNDLAGHGPGCPCGFNIAASSSNIISEQWYQIVGVFNSGQNIKLYINGIEVASTATSETALFDIDQPFIIGAQNQYDQLSNYWDGKIDDAFMYNRALTAQEISNLYNRTQSYSNINNLIGHWDFNQGSGSELDDLSEIGNDGTIYGATWSDDVPSSGCTDPYAENYNVDASVDDGSCTYPDNGNFALSFDGVDDYVQLPEISSSIGAVNSSFSIISWFKKSNPDAGVFIHSRVVGNSANQCGRIESTTENKIKYYQKIQSRTIINRFK